MIAVDVADWQMGFKAFLLFSFNSGRQRTACLFEVVVSVLFWCWVNDETEERHTDWSDESNSNLPKEEQLAVCLPPAGALLIEEVSV